MKVRTMSGPRRAVIAILCGFATFGLQIGGARAIGNTLTNEGFETAGETAGRAADWQDFYSGGYKRTNAVRYSGSWSILLNSSSSSAPARGAAQRIDLNQTELKPVFVGAYLKGANIANSGSFLGASIYAEIHLANGKTVYWNSISNKGTFAWNWIGFNTGTLTNIDSPIEYMFVVPILADSKGKAYFDDIQVVEHEPGEAALTIMIDDGESSTYTAAKPIMDGFGYVGSTAIIVNSVGKSGFMSWAQLTELSKAGWEIVSHGLSHADLTTMNATALRNELAKSQRLLRSRGFTANNFAVPYGAYNGNVLAVGAKYYKSMRLYEQGANPKGAFPYDVKVRGVLDTTTPEEISSWIGDAQENGQWLVLTFHAISETGNDAYHYAPDDFEEVLGIIRDSGIRVMTYDAAVSAFKASPSDKNTVFGD